MDGRTDGQSDPYVSLCFAGYTKLWYYVKGPVTRIIHVKYESPVSHGSQVMTKVKVFEKYM